MQLGQSIQAVHLLTADFGAEDRKDAKPPGPKEWGDFTEWLKQQGRRPAELINGRSGDLVLVSPYHPDAPTEALFKAFLEKIRTDRAPDKVINTQ